MIREDIHENISEAIREDICEDTKNEVLESAVNTDINLQDEERVQKSEPKRRKRKTKALTRITILHEDIIKANFWELHPELGIEANSS